MGKESEFGTKMRLLEVLRSLLERPFGYTKKELANRHKCHKDTIKKDFEAFENAGFLLERDKRYRYRFVESKPYKALKDLLHFSEEEQVLLEEAINEIATHTERGEKLKRKLASLYDYHRLGHSYLRKPYLNKVDLLLQAKNEKRAVTLVDYSSSNSNVVHDRYVEPFHPSPPDDMLHAYDLNKKGLRHFRISRIKRVKLREENWQFENLHTVKLTDPFRIVDSQQEMVHLRMKVGAKNELVERFPLAKGYIEEASEDEIYDFQCMVNHRFLGLTNFILGHYHQWIEVLAPDSLLDHLRGIVKKMRF